MEDEKIKKDLDLWIKRKEALNSMSLPYFHSICQIYGIIHCNDKELMVSEIVKKMGINDALLLKCFLVTMGMY